MRKCRVTRYPPKLRIEYLHEATVLHTEVDEAWIREEVTRISGIMGYKQRWQGWATTRVAFDIKEKADTLQRKLHRWRHEQERAAVRCLMLTSQ